VSSYGYQEEESTAASATETSLETQAAETKQSSSET
jgi:hypothetical protein